ncbi:MAG TPA: potassium-transporting ATPase subunit KdpA [Thermoanaerobaculales bacterium]|nr:potassium-transporting ATPase subunit KdpA [Thermoanaerobaculales bacterium]HPA79237.1 potassium-transporting ATPase subunit KdpA [Thermoanaerobaculales bacterium]HQL28717.1 potassium-transporting ATPase subunit KdpA [Thermoanaerobaculales bacterium]HQN96767.1 potassium-transporting ATPase subunit KdpA [Thermoanaerobaculales bacterium]HQP42919.1 potassium-transporting ATPase subunit KdpA [Thermoanaerobaculales bacterium]
MTAPGWIQILVFLAIVLLAAPPLGSYLHRVLEGGPHALARPLGWLERLVYRACRVDGREQPWPRYTGSLLAFSGVSLLATYAIERLQHLLPLNPQHLGPVEPLSAFNTAASFTTNTNWQAYAGEATMSCLTQMAGLAWQNFVSAAAGMAVAVALARGLTRRGEGKGPGTIGNVWVDLTRGTVYVLLPASLVVALVFASQGVVQSLAPSRVAATLDGGEQAIPLGPVASQEAIKQLGTNGGGFFNANAAHPFENPTPLTNFVSMLLIFAIPAGLVWTFGRMAGDRRQGLVLLAAMSILFLAGATAVYWAEAAGNPVLPLPSPAGNLEGKEVRFGVAGSALYATVTTDASCGAVNSMHGSFTPLGGLVTLFNIQLGEVVFGGVGAGLYGMLVMALLAVFIAGLMVGRTPEYLGKKVESREVRLAVLFVLLPTLLILAGAAASAVNPSALSSLGNAGPHGLTELNYAYSSAAGNNGSAFAGLAADTPWFNLTLGVAMLAGRFWMIVLVLAIAGSMAGKKVAPPSAGTFPTTGLLFLALLIGVIVIVGALTFLPALSLGPVVEHFLARAGRVF